MRLHRLAVQAFGPFAGLVDVDFDALGSGGIFLIHGPTGAGKTSLLDAICFALYADVPGVRPAGRALRSDHAHGDTAPRVTLELTAGSRRLRIERSPEYRRPKRRGTGETTVPASVTLSERIGGTWQSLSTRADEAGEIVRDVLGLGLRQFVKVVLLPQGDFATFLRATPESRREVLERLFDVSRYTDIEEWLAEHRRRAGSLLSEARAALATDQARLDDVLARLPAGVVGDLPEWDTIPVGALDAALAAPVDRVHEHAATALAERDAAEAEERRRTASHDEASRLRDCRTRGRAARAVLTDLQLCADELSATARQVQAGRRAASVAGDLRALTAATARAQDARTAVEDAATALAGLGLADLGSDRDAARAVAAVAAGLGDDLATAERLRLEVDLVACRVDRQEAAAAADHDALTEVEHEVAEATDALVDLRRRAGPLSHATTDLLLAQVLVERLETARRRRTDLDRCEEQLSRAREDERTAADTELRARADWLDLRATQLAGMAGRLAAGLVAGQACPVCGSCRHPHPADPRVAIPDDAVVAAEAVVTVSAAHLDRARARVSGLAGQAAGLLGELADEGRDATTLTADLVAAQADCRVIEARAAELAELSGRIDQVAAQLDAARHERDEISSRAQEAAGRLAEVRTALERGRRDLAEAARRHTETCPCAVVTGHVGVAVGTGNTGDAVGAGDTDDAVGAGDWPDPAVRHHEVVTATRRLLASWDVLDQAEEHLDVTAEGVRIRLAECGFRSEDEARAAVVQEESLSAWERSLARADRERVQVETVLADPDVALALAQPEPDLDALAQDALEARRARQAAERAHAVAEECDRDLGRLRERLREVTAEVSERLQHQQRIARLADTAAGLGPDNTLRMRLSAFVLAAHLERVVDLANERLRHLGEGRYRLRHTDEPASGGRRSGLGLQVEDLWTGQARDPATLSGGESFMASLALALGLADAVREEAGGFDVQTLFVDEGFGTLDEDSLEQVLAVLDDLRDGGRAVGIVSHVADLRSRIPHQLQVTKTPAGSSVVQREGRAGAA